MKRFKMAIAARQDELRNHRLFELLAASRSTAPLAEMARALSWWPMVFQDVLRLNVERIRGTALRRWAEHHRTEDAGHDRWFLGDLRALGVEAPGLDELFGDDFQPIRDACYALVGEVRREHTDAERVALLLVLESTGHVFFEQVAAGLDRVCPALPLRYFAQFHLEVELDHELFTASTDLECIVLGDAERAGVEAAVDRVYGAFADIFSYLADRMSDIIRGEPRGRIDGLAAVRPAARASGAGWFSWLRRVAWPSQAPAVTIGAAAPRRASG